MKKRNLMILMVSLAFVFGCLTTGFFSKIKIDEPMNVYGTYVSDFDTLSVNHDLTYQYWYPFSCGKITKIDEDIYFFSEGIFNDCIAIFDDENVKLVTLDEGEVKKIFSKISTAETDLGDH